MSTPKKIKARRMYCTASEIKKGNFLLATYKRNAGYVEKLVAVLDVSDEDALIEQVADAIYVYTTLHVWAECENKSPWQMFARAILESLNLISKRRAKK